MHKKDNTEKKNSERWWLDVRVKYGLGTLALLSAFVCMYLSQGKIVPWWRPDSHDLLPGSSGKAYDSHLHWKIIMSLLSVAVPYTIITRPRVLAFIIRHLVKNAKIGLWQSVVLVLAVAGGLFVWGVVVMRYVISRLM